MSVTANVVQVHVQGTDVFREVKSNLFFWPLSALLAAWGRVETVRGMTWALGAMKGVGNGSSQT